MEAFYLKYRPRSLAELDNSVVRETLLKILKSELIPHAFLFSGPKGTGKTSTARIVAKTLACPQRKNGLPCNRCSVCQASEQGNNLDIVEIDAASNRGIDDIRQLRQHLSLSPLQSANKIYIVDEVHMLTNEAFNAILKTLEEPPEHVYFIFCTTNPEKIPETVLSRLTTVRFQRARPEEIISALKRAVKGEKLKIEAEALALIATAADGSFRDGHKLLYQLYLSEGKEITLTAAKKLLGRWLTILPQRLIFLILTQQQFKAMEVVRQLEEKGVDFSDYLRRCLLATQELLFYRLGVVASPAGADLNWLAEQSPQKLAQLAQAFAAALREEKETPLPALPLQLLIANWPPKIVGVSPQQNRSQNNKKVVTANPKRPKEGGRVVNKEKQKKGSVITLEEVNKRWQELLAAIKPFNHSVVALLKGCRPQKVEKGQLWLAVFYKFHFERLREERNRQIVEKGLMTVFGGRWQIHCQLTPRPKKEIIENPVTEGKEGEKAAKTEKSEDDELFAAAKEIFS